MKTQKKSLDFSSILSYVQKVDISKKKFCVLAILFTQHFEQKLRQKVFHNLPTNEWNVNNVNNVLKVFKTKALPS